MARTTTSGGNRKPLNAEFGTARTGRDLILRRSPRTHALRHATVPYTKPTFTPPKLSGIFVMPKGVPKGDNVVTVTLVQPLLGLPLANIATSTIKRVG
jgi:hypothetical protein